METLENGDTMDESVISALGGLLVKYSVVLDKSQTPAVRQAKSEAYGNIRHDLFTVTGKSYDESKIRRMVNNLKARLKKKAEVQATVSRPIKLSTAEKQMFAVLQAQDIPLSKRGQGEITKIGIQNSMKDMNTHNTEDNCECSSPKKSRSDVNERLPLSSVPLPSILPMPPSLLPAVSGKLLPLKNIAPKGLPNETAETRNWSTAELKRAVLLEQLSCYRAMRNYYEQINAVTNDLNN